MLAGSSTCAQTRLHAYDPKASAKEGLPWHHRILSPFGDGAEPISVEKIQQVNGEQDKERRPGSMSGVFQLYLPSKLPTILSEQSLSVTREGSLASSRGQELTRTGTVIVVTKRGDLTHCAYGAQDGESWCM